MSFLYFYYTPRSVGIEHKKLGLLYWFFVGLAISYTFFTVFASKGYLEFDTLNTAVSIKVKWVNSDQQVSLEDYDYCASETNADGSKRKCAIWDRYQMGRAFSDNAYFLVTKVHEIQEERACPLDSKSCNSSEIWKKKSSKKFFVPGIEKLALKIEHSFTAPLFYDESQDPYYSQSNFDMRGVFIDGQRGGEILDRFPTGKSDILKVSDLIASSKINLDTTSHTLDKKKGVNETFRNSGFTILLDLHYNNAICRGSLYQRFFETRCVLGTVAPVYRYRASSAPSPVRIQEITQEDPVSGTRLRRTLHGVVVKVQQAGSIGRFSWSVLLVQLAAGLGFFSVATMVVDNLSYYFIVGEQFESSKYVYYDHKFTRKTPAPTPNVDQK